MDVFQKYRIHIIDGRRYYEYRVDEELPSLENTIPYQFKYRDINVIDSRWNQFSLKILCELDARDPKPDEYLLGLRYGWSKTDVFSREKKTNFVKFRDIYLNANHTSTHSLMSIQRLLLAYGVNLSECFLLIRRHPVAEPPEVREYLIDLGKKGFAEFLSLKGFSADGIAKILKNFDIINAILAKASPNFDNFYLFDDYYYFINYKSKTIDKARRIYWKNEKNVQILKKYLGYFGDYLKNKETFGILGQTAVPVEFKHVIKEEITKLFSLLKTSIIVAEKLYARIRILHGDKLAECSNLDSARMIYEYARLNFGGLFYFSYPYISKIPISPGITNDEIVSGYARSLDQFTVQDLTEYTDKMQIGHVDNYFSFLSAFSDEYLMVAPGTMKKKSLVDVDDEYLLKLCRHLSFVISSFGAIDSRTFQGYASIPRLPMFDHMDKFLLFGLIASYLTAKFDLRCFGGKYNDFDYQINLKE